jgi:hypothetical protein
VGEELLAAVLALEGVQVELHVAPLHQLDGADGGLLQLAEARSQLELLGVLGGGSLQGCGAGAPVVAADLAEVAAQFTLLVLVLILPQILAVVILLNLVPVE